MGVSGSYSPPNTVHMHLPNTHDIQRLRKYLYDKEQPVDPEAPPLDPLPFELF